ncbi:hypothetical protein SUGI_0833010 [Cryptomeria japonica]|nr:hypothetical protein SUGI_0833010 [Cryptomeria japonica]
MREEMYKISKEMGAKIRDFKIAIRRPYFHIKPLDDAQLSNWHHYRDFIEKTNDFDRMVTLFERCLIVCANYPEYWIRTRYLQIVEGNAERENKVLTEAFHLLPYSKPCLEIEKRYQKHPAQDSLTLDKSKVAKSYVVVPATMSPTQFGVAAYPNDQDQWGAGYAQHLQSWQQPPAQ